MESRVGFWPRVGAHLVDMVLILGVSFLLKGVIASLFPGAIAAAIAEQTRANTTAALKPALETMAAFGVASTAIWPFYGLIEAFTGWSPAKRLLGLRIAGEDGRPAPRPRLFARYAVKGAANILALLGLVTGAKTLSTAGGAMSLVILAGFSLVLRSSRQALHDMAVRTAVVRASRAVA
jgi:uncharacterized RDD family membrane protein YckC